MKHRNFFVLAMLSLLFITGCKQKDPNLTITAEIKDGWTFRQADKEEWLPATVPGCVHTDLMKNGKIEDPFYRLNEHNLQWIDKVNWEYKTTFTPIYFPLEGISFSFTIILPPKSVPPLTSTLYLSHQTDPPKRPSVFFTLPLR